MTGQFIKLPYAFVDKEGPTLSPYALAVYISMKRMRGKKTSRNEIKCTNWDFIPFGYSDVMFPMSKKTFQKAIEELRRRKLIKLEVPGQFPNKKAVYSLCNYRR